MKSPVVTDNPEVARIIKETLQLLLEHGAEFADGLQIREESGSLSVHSIESNAQGDPLIKLPDELLIPLDQFTLASERGKIIIGSTRPGVDSIHHRLMALMVALYNETDKLNYHIQNDPLFQLGADHPVFQTLMQGFGDTEGPITMGVVGSNEPDLLEGFIHTRCLSASPDGEQSAFMMPIAEMVNNHYAGASFFDENFHGVHIRQQQPLGDTQCFVNYNSHDALGLLLWLRYVDLETPYVHSVPLISNIPGRGKIHIKDIHSKLINLPKSNRSAIEIEQNEQTVSCRTVTISPDERFDTLGLALTLMLKRLGAVQDQSPDGSKPLLQLLERQIVSENRAYYGRLEKLARESERTATNALVLDNVEVVARRQRELLARRLDKSWR